MPTTRERAVDSPSFMRKNASPSNMSTLVYNMSQRNSNAEIMIGGSNAAESNPQRQHFQSNRGDGTFRPNSPRVVTSTLRVSGVQSGASMKHSPSQKSEVRSCGGASTRMLLIKDKPQTKEAGPPSTMSFNPATSYNTLTKYQRK